MQDLLIKSIINGYELCWQEDNRLLTKVIEDINDNEEETMTRLLMEVAEYFGINYDKYKNNNLNISFDKIGHKASDDLIT